MDDTEKVPLGGDVRRLVSAPEIGRGYPVDPEILRGTLRDVPKAFEIVSGDIQDKDVLCRCLKRGGTVYASDPERIQEIVAKTGLGDVVLRYNTTQKPV